MEKINKRKKRALFKTEVGRKGERSANRSVLSKYMLS